MRRPRPSFRPRLERLDDRRLLSALTPAQVTSAYGLNAISFSAGGQTVKGTGAGQIIALIEAYHDPNIASDLAKFDQTYNLPAAPLLQVNLAGSGANDGWAEEEMLDVEWAHAIAPGAAIMVVEAKSDGLWDLLSAVNWARTVPYVSTVSMSWGSTEFSGQAGLDAVFTTPAGHTGVTFIAASGDSGAAGGAEWPASSANVLSVGGTTLQIGASGTYLGESLWSGSSGGLSGYVAEPAFQRSLQSTGRRSTPDVSFVGDPNTGASVYETTPSTGVGGWYQVGGTSLGAPAWAGVLAVVNQGRVKAGKTNLDGVSQTLPAIYALPSTDFHQVASLTSFSRSGTTTVTAGLGTPNGPALVNGLVSTGVAARSFATTSAQVVTRSVVATAATTIGQSATFQPLGSGQGSLAPLTWAESPAAGFTAPVPTAPSHPHRPNQALDPLGAVLPA